MRIRFVAGLAALLILSAVGAGASQGRAPAVGVAGQFLWEKVQADPGRDVEGIEEFRTRRIRLYLAGKPGERVEYGITLAHNDAAQMETGVYEAWVRFQALEWLSVKAGSFLPPWSLEMSRSIHSLDYIQYPLVVGNGLPLCTPWRQTGIMLEVRPGQSFSISTGLFNGLDREGEYLDDNNMKDTMVSVSYTAYTNVDLYLGHWGGETELSPALASQLGASSVDYSNIWVGLSAQVESLRFTGEMIWNRVNSDSSTLRQARGYHASFVYTWKNLEALMRYEQFDPDSGNVGAGAENEVEWTTVGLNYALADWAKLMANYVFKSEPGDQRANEQMLLQVSVAF